MDLVTMRRELFAWLLRGAAVGLIFLGIGGRVLMRIIAHMEHRPVFVLTVGGTLTVIFAGTVFGLLAGLVYWLVRLLVRRRMFQAAVFAATVELMVWVGVRTLLPLPQLMFMTLAMIFIAIVLSMGRRTMASPV